MKPPILFLDYDGCLHPDAAYRVYGKIILRAPGHALFEYVDVLVDALKPYPQIRIVLSTTWVRALGFDSAKSFLPAVLSDRVIGATFHSRSDRYEWLAMTRFQQIFRYVERHNLTAWLALDDNNDCWPEPLLDRLVCPGSMAALGEADIVHELKNKLKLLVKQTARAEDSS